MTARTRRKVLERDNQRERDNQHERRFAFFTRGGGPTNVVKGVNTASLKRICRRAGILRVQKDVYAEMRKQLVVQLNDILKPLVIQVDYARRKTVMLEDVAEATKKQGVSIYGLTRTKRKKRAPKKRKRESWSPPSAAASPKKLSTNPYPTPHQSSIPHQSSARRTHMNAFQRTQEEKYEAPEDFLRDTTRRVKKQSRSGTFF